MALLTEKDRQYCTPEDICTHLGDDYAAFHGAIVPPIYQNSLFVQPTECNGVTQTDYVYTRVGNPTIDIAERKIAALEGGDGALCFGSGMAAISTAVLYFARQNCHIIMVSTAYGPAIGLLRYLQERYGIEYTLVRGDSVEEIEQAIRPETRLIYLESPSSLVFRLQDLEAIAAIAKARGIGTVIDNSYATPLHQKPLSYGIDIVCHTVSKYLGGHSDIVAGALAARKEIIESITNNERSLFGGIMDPHQAWLLIRSMRTLPIRLRQHGENGAKVAAHLEQHPKVKRVFYPGSATFPQPELFKKYLSGTNGLLSIVPNGSPEEILRFVGNLHLFQRGVSWGGFESLCVPVGEVEDIGYIVRLHVGLEDPNTLIADLDQALSLLPDEA